MFSISHQHHYLTLSTINSQWLATDRWFSLGPLVSSTNKTDCHNITEILLKVALNTIKQTNKQTISFMLYFSFFLWEWGIVLVPLSSWKCGVCELMSCSTWNNGMSRMWSSVSNFCLVFQNLPSIYRKYKYHWIFLVLIWKVN